MIIQGSNYGPLRPVYAIKRPKRVPRWRCACVRCKAKIVITQTKVLKGVCPECRSN
jgi:hypothetical protein